MHQRTRHMPKPGQAQAIRRDGLLQAALTALLLLAGAAVMVANLVP